MDPPSLGVGAAWTTKAEAPLEAGAVYLTKTRCKLGWTPSDGVSEFVDIIVPCTPLDASLQTPVCSLTDDSQTFRAAIVRASAMVIFHAMPLLL